MTRKFHLRRTGRTVLVASCLLAAAVIVGVPRLLERGGVPGDAVLRQVGGHGEGDAEGTRRGGDGSPAPPGGMWPDGKAEPGMSVGSGGGDGGQAGQGNADVPREGGSHVLVHDSRDVPDLAGELLGRYREGGGCVLVSAGYADLLGRVWVCVVQGDGWVDVCEVSAAPGGGCREAVTRLRADEWGEGVDAL